MAGFNSPSGDLQQIYVDDYALIDQYATTGSLWAWGGSFAGLLGNNSNSVDQSSPVQTVAAGTNWKLVVSGTYFAAAIKTDGTLWLWGSNNYGELGNNNITPRSSPVQTVAGGTNWKLVACGSGITAAIKTDGTLWEWGLYAGTSSPIQTLAGGTNWKLVSCGGYQTGAIKTDGTLWMWGAGYNGALGTNDGLSQSSPVQTVAGGTNWKQVGCGKDHTAAIKTDGTLWTWGLNLYGQLGTNDVTIRSSPIQTVAAGTNWKQVACGSNNTAAIKTDGTLWLWGDNNSGNLGTTDVTFRSSPVQTVSGGTNWKSVSSGWNHTAAIKTDGTLWTWGLNSDGRLGTNNLTSYSSPVQTVAGGTNWKLVSCGKYNTFAVYFYDANNLYPGA